MLIYDFCSGGGSIGLVSLLPGKIDPERKGNLTGSHASHVYPYPYTLFTECHSYIGITTATPEAKKALMT